MHQPLDGARRDGLWDIVTVVGFGLGKGLGVELVVALRFVVAAVALLIASDQPWPSAWTIAGLVLTYAVLTEIRLQLGTGLIGLDVSAAVSYLGGRLDVRDGRIAVVGMSMGGEEAVAAIGADPRIRAIVAETYGDDVAEAVRIQYGGSMKPENAADLLSEDDIDGGLIGGASLTVEDFAAILAAAKR